MTRLQHPPGAQRGVALMEALVAMVVMALGMLAIAGIQATMRLNADVARQRSEANRLAQGEMEALRSFVIMATTPGKLAWDDIITPTPAEREVDLQTANARFVLQRIVTTSASPALKSLSVTVSWVDRTGQRQSVVLNSIIAGAEPGLSGLLSVAPAATAADRPGGRHHTIPSAAKNFGDGTSGFVPAPGATVAWVFNNTTGVITSVCVVQFGQDNTTLTTAALQLCTATTAQLLSGQVRFNHFDGAAALTAADAEDPPGPPLNLNISLSLRHFNQHASGSGCFDNAPTTQVASIGTVSVDYFCIIMPSVSVNWTGSTRISPQAFSDTGVDWSVRNNGSHKVCRYTPSATDNALNVDHPLEYSDVTGNLINQNFLVIVEAKSCPTDVAANPATGDFVNTNTLQHQP